mgnify:CR=1 FL=1
MKERQLVGRILRYAGKIYGITWRYFFCISQLRKPLNKKRIVFFSHKGKQYSCNPMYICEYLLEKYPGEFQMVWAFKEPEKFSYLKDKGIEVVKFESVAHMRAMVTAKVIVTNVDTFVYLPKRKGQIVLDTWHGGGAYKTCGFMNPQNLNRIRKKLHFKRLYSRITLYLSSSKMFSQQTIRQSRIFEGEILEYGMPRNDILVRGDREDIKKKVRNYFGLAEDVKIVLYAPTFRSEKENENYPKPDFYKVESALSRRFGGKWCTLFRQHHFYEEEQGGLSASGYQDMQELLYTADVLITDYSSSIWDFSLMFKPVFLYCPDLQHYKDERNFYIPIEKWPFILCESQQELVANIECFDKESYDADIREHHKILGNCETGFATQKICDKIYKECS